MAASKDEISLTHTFESDALTCKAQDKTHAIVNMKAMSYEPEGEERKNLDLICVLDRSGSMAGKKMELLKETCEFVVREMRSVDRLCFVAYDNEVTLSLPMTKMDKNGKEEALQALASIHPRGATNLSGGLLRGLQAAKESGSSSSNSICSVLLLTDGMANNGITDSKAVAKAVSQFSSGLSNPPSVFTFGYGKDHDSEMLREIADAGSGVYYFLDTQDSVASSFADCLGGLLTVVAQNISLKVKSVTKTSITKIHTQYKTKTIKEGREYEILFNDMYSEEERDILFSLNIPEVKSPLDDQPILEFSLTYFSVPGSSLKDASFSATVNRANKSSQKNDKVSWQAGRVAATEALEEADKLGKQGKYDEGRKILTNARAQVEGLQNYTKSPMCVQLCTDLNEATDSMQDRANYLSRGQYQMKSKAMEHNYQRSCSSSVTPNAYRSKAKSSMMSRWSEQRSAKTETIDETLANSFSNTYQQQQQQLPLRTPHSQHRRGSIDKHQINIAPQKKRSKSFTKSLKNMFSLD